MLTVPSLTMMQGTTEIKTAIANICNQIKENPRILLRGAPLRMVAGFFGTIALSQDTRQFLCEEIKIALDTVS